jgi:hypothetical protein
MHRLVKCFRPAVRHPHLERGRGQHAERAGQHRGAVASFSTDPALVGRGAILGQMTTGFPLSPLTASTFILLIR